MADRQARIEIETGGAERAAAAARTALSPWVEYAGKAQSAFKSFRGEVGSAVGGVLQDLGRVVTVGSSISFAGAVNQVQSLERATSQLAVATGSGFDAMKSKINALSEATGTSGEQIANFVNNVGRATYDFQGATKNLETFRKFALETGRELTDTGGLATGLKRMGVEDAAKAIDQIRANARSLGTVGGVGALADQVSALAGAFSKASNSSAQLVAVTAQLGKGLNPQQAAEVQQSVIGHFAGAERQYEAHFRANGMLKSGETLIDRKTGKFDIVRAMQLRQAELRRMGPEMAFRIASGNLGSPQAAAQFLAMNFGATGDLAAQTAGTNALGAWQATPGGKAESDAATQLRKMQGIVGHDSILGGFREGFRGFAAEHPIAGALGEFGISAVLGGFGKKLTGGSSETGQTAGTVAKMAAAYRAYKALRAAQWLARAKYVLEGGEVVTTGSAATTAAIAGGGLLGALGSVFGLGYATAPLNEKRAQIQGEQAAQFYNLRAGRARSFIRAAERSGGTEEGFIHEVGAPLLAQAGYTPTGERDPRYKDVADPALASLFEQLRAGTPDIKGLPKDIATEVANALKGSPLEITVVNGTGGPIEVQQPGGYQ